MALDKGHKKADKELKALEKRIQKEYGQAYTEMKEKTEAWLETFRQRETKMLADLREGKITHKDYIEWRQNNMLSTKQMKGIVGDLSRTLDKYDERANELINGHAKSVFVSQYNYGVREVKDALGNKVDSSALSFSLVDEHTVNRLLKEDIKLLPKIDDDDKSKKKRKKWNEQKLQSALTQGILQGDPIDKMAKRLQTVEKMTSGQAVRTARTMTTSAENGGRMASYHDAEEMGIEMMKTWVATLDDRTRDAHAELDGVTIPVDEPFRNSIGDIMFPADPDADGENVYNCRCTLIASIKNVPRNMAIRQRK